MTPPPAMTSGLRALRSTSTARLSAEGDRKSTRLNSSHGYISYAVFCLKKKKKPHRSLPISPIRYLANILPPPIGTYDRLPATPPAIRALYTCDMLASSPQDTLAYAIST